MNTHLYPMNQTTQLKRRVCYDVVQFILYHYAYNCPGAIDPNIISMESNSSKRSAVITSPSGSNTADSVESNMESLTVVGDDNGESVEVTKASVVCCCRDLGLKAVGCINVDLKIGKSSAFGDSNVEESKEGESKGAS